MTFKRATLLSAAVLAFATLGWLALPPGKGMATAHKPGHVNCPPGSHGQPRYTGVGERLEKARQEAREQARATRTLATP